VQLIGAPEEDGMVIELGPSMLGPADTPAESKWPPRPLTFPDLLNPVEAAQYLRLDETGLHTPRSAARTLKFWRDRGELRATKYARHVWYRKSELDRFLSVKTES
jgi:hypothetical protein